MSSNVPINQHSDITAPTPQNTPLTHAPITAGLPRPTVPDITEDAEPAEDSAAVHEAMLGLVQGRLAGLLGKSSGYIESLSDGTKTSIVALIGVQVKQNELQNQYKRECLELEKKVPPVSTLTCRYSAVIFPAILLPTRTCHHYSTDCACDSPAQYLELTKPLYERRRALIYTAAVPTPEELDAGAAQAAKDNPEENPFLVPPSTAPAAVPDFWLTVLRNHVGLSELITDRDAGALKYLNDLRIEYLPSSEPKPGFKLIFEFASNEFFENEKLEKTYVYREEVGYSGDFVYDRAIGTEIKWKDEKDLTKEFEIKKQRNKNTNRTRLVRKAHPTESFFNFFSPPVAPSEEAIEEGDIGEEELDELEEKLEIDYQIGEDIKEKIIPRAVDYFTGKALEYDMLSDDEDDYDEDDEDDDGDGFEDDDSDEDDPPAPRRSAGGRRGGRGDLPSNVNPEECKQQ
ncbi:NAP-domain-containing protein [Lactarius deliciosus]|nr:NAP-domain-containing protein [Lactarius deliciosus]